MFWRYEEWTNAFLIQFIAIIVAFVVGRKNKIGNTDIFIAIAMVSPVALFTISAGVAGAIFLSDLVAVYLLFREKNPIKKTKFVILVFLLYIVWPILSTIFSIIYSPSSSQLTDFDTKILIIQFLRYFLYFILFAKLLSKPYDDPTYLLKFFKVQSVVLFFVFVAILLGYLGLIKVDAWNELVKIDFEDKTLGIGGMFLYRGGVGTLGTISIPLIYFCYIYGKGFYKYLMMFLIFIILISVLFSGSRQGISLSLLSLLMSLLLFRQYKNAFKIIIIGSALFFGIMQNQVVRETSEWVLKRYEVFLDDKADVKNEIRERNFAVDNAEKQEKDFFYEINGFGLGGDIMTTESDYYNTYSYFGIIGSMIYYFFIFFTAFKIYKHWKETVDTLKKNIILITLLIAVLLPMLGFQQWYVMTYASTNSMNVFLILFMFSIGLVEKIKNYQ